MFPVKLHTKSAEGPVADRNDCNVLHITLQDFSRNIYIYGAPQSFLWLGESLKLNTNIKTIYLIFSPKTHYKMVLKFPRYNQIKFQHVSLAAATFIKERQLYNLT